jgi:hypothetical protein
VLAGRVAFTRQRGHEHLASSRRGGTGSGFGHRSPAALQAQFGQIELAVPPRWVCRQQQTSNTDAATG